MATAVDATGTPVLLVPHSPTVDFSFLGFSEFRAPCIGEPSKEGSWTTPWLGWKLLGSRLAFGLVPTDRVADDLGARAALALLPAAAPLLASKLPHCQTASPLTALVASACLVRPSHPGALS